MGWAGAMLAGTLGGVVLSSLLNQSSGVPKPPKPPPLPTSAVNKAKQAKAVKKLTMKNPNRIGQKQTILTGNANRPVEHLQKQDLLGTYKY